MSPSRPVTPNPIVNEIEVMTSYDVDAPLPTPQPLREIEKIPLAQVNLGIGERGADNLPFKSPSAGGGFHRFSISPS